MPEYKNPLIVEQVATIKGHENSIAEGQLLSIQKELAPLNFYSEILSQVEIATEIRSASEIPSIRSRTSKKLVLKNSDSSLIVQFFNNRFTINQVRKYDWGEFEGLLEKVCRVGLPLFGAQPLELGIQARDIFHVDDNDYNLTDWIVCDGYLVPKWYAGFTGSFDVSLGMGFLNLDHLNRVFNLKVRKMEKKVEFFSESSVWEMGTRENYMQVFGNLRTKSNDIFEGWITDKVRTEIMGGLK